MSVRVRFAPSPTGSLHVGGARTALFNYLLAKKHGGQFILRIEDTDLERNKESYIKEQLEALSWLGIDWDEGPLFESLTEYKGNVGPYRQSQRQNIYHQYAQKLLKEGKAYYCFLTDEEISQSKLQAKEKGLAYRVQSPYREANVQELKKRIDQGEKAVIRFKMPEKIKKYSFDDIVRKDVTFPSDMVGDFVILRSNGMPVYNFCCAIDDALMKITHVFRAEEHLANTLRQFIILESLNFKPPKYGHLSIILDKDKKKLSKRAGAVSCLEYKKQGFLPEAMNNFLALLGWNPKSEKEIFSITELIQYFSEKGLNSSGAVFDETKLKWINAQHLRQMPYLKLWNLLVPVFEKQNLKFPKNTEWIEQSVQCLKPSFSNIIEAVEIYQTLAENYFTIDPTACEIKDWEGTKTVLKEWENYLKNYHHEYIKKEDFKNIINQIQKKLNIKGKFLFMPLRVSIIGKSKGLELNQVVPLIKKEILLQRVNVVLNEWGWASKEDVKQ